MFVFGDPKDNQEYIFIHIPKNCGRFVRAAIIHNLYKYIKFFWMPCPERGIDMGHTPYKMIPFYWNRTNEKVVSYLRNPYDRLISGYFMVYNNIPGDKKTRFLNWIKNDLIKLEFDDSFKPDIVHFYPQYKFLEDDNGNIPEEIILYKLEEYNKDTNLLDFTSHNFTLPKYNLDDYYDREALDIVNFLFEKDFKLLGYEMK